MAARQHTDSNRSFYFLDLDGVIVGGEDFSSIQTDEGDILTLRIKSIPPGNAFEIENGSLFCDLEIEAR